MDRTLILSCSQRKRPDPGFLPAIDRYDGPPFRVLRRYLRQPEITPPHIRILSAEFGLIPPDEPIPDYDRLMTPTRAVELRPRVGEALRRITLPTELTPPVPTRLFHNLGQNYLLATVDFDALASGTLHITSATGPPGVRLSHLSAWLYADAASPSLPCSTEAKRRTVRFHGMELTMTTEEALEAGRFALAHGQGRPDKFSSWYVDFDGQQVAPKWMVGALSGLPVAAFTTAQARSVLTRLGVEVRRL